MTRVTVWNYFDIETTGLEPESSKVITAQFQRLCYGPDGRRWDDGSKLQILKEWDLAGEEELLRKVYEEFFNTTEKRQNFCPIGNSLSFEGKFLKNKFSSYRMIGTDEHLQFGRLWSLDLRHVLIPINNGWGTYPQLLGKNGQNANIPALYEAKEFDKIEDYIMDETNKFIKTTDFLMKELPALRNRILDLHR